MKKYILLLFIFLTSSPLFAEDKNTLSITPSQTEALFIQQNLQLLAGRHNIDIAEAEIVQAKLWNNPELSVNSLNLWSTSGQREGESEVIPPLFGSFARNTQFSIELNQLIQTAGKRRKLVSREKVSKEIALQEFEDILRSLKYELRTLVDETVYLQNYLKVLQSQQQYIEGLIGSYRQQAEQGNIAKSELLRLQSSALGLESEINETQTELNGKQRNLKILLNAKPHIDIEINDDRATNINPEDLPLARLMDMAAESRPDVQQQKLQTQYYEKSLAYEKSMRVPDITVSANYDRYGGVWKNFVGFGLSFDLPFFDRNQGNIKIAKLRKEQSDLLLHQQENTALHEVAEAYSNYIQAYRFHKKINKNDLLTELDTMLETYTRNLQNRNISMLEYTDFIDTYKANKQTVLTAKMKMNNLFEELQYVVGSDIRHGIK